MIMIFSQKSIDNWKIRMASIAFIVIILKLKGDNIRRQVLILSFWSTFDWLY